MVVEYVTTLGLAVFFFSCHKGGLSLRGHERIFNHGIGWLCIDSAVDMKCFCSL